MSSVIEFVKSDAGKLTATCVLLIVEFWLGKTEKVKAGSLIEVVLNGIKSLAKLVKGSDAPPKA